MPIECSYAPLIWREVLSFSYPLAPKEEMRRKRRVNGRMTVPVPDKQAGVLIGLFLYFTFKRLLAIPESFRRAARSRFHLLGISAPVANNAE